MKKEQNFTDRTALLNLTKRSFIENWEIHKCMLRSVPLNKKQKRFGLVYRVQGRMTMKKINESKGQKNDAKL